MRVGVIGLLGAVVLVAGCGRSHTAPNDSPRVPAGARLDGGPATTSALADRAASVAQEGAGRRIECRGAPEGDGCSNENAASPHEPEFAEGRLIVKFKDRLREPADVVHSRGLRFADHCPSGGQELDSLNARYHVGRVAPVFVSWFGTATAEPGRGAQAERRKRLQAAVGRTRAAFPARSTRAPANAQVPDLTNVYYLEVPAGTDIRRMALDYSSNENVEYAVPDQLARVSALPNDPYLYTGWSWGQDYPDLWGIKKIGAPAAWDTATGLGMVVAVVDTGLDYQHADIAANVWTNQAEAAGSPGVDDDANGYTDDVRGWDFAYGNADVMDRHGHGTAVAGVIAATGDNAIGVIGVAYQARIMPVKALRDSGSGSFGNLADAITYAARNGADVINGSFGCYGCTSSVLQDAAALARSLGCIVAFAAGNDGAGVKWAFPANLQDVLTVASTGQDDRRSSFSNFGYLVDVAAPGGGPGSTGVATANVLSLRAAGTGSATYVVGTDYIRMAGTSLATPHVSGVAASLLSVNPGLSVAQVESIIKHTAADQVGDPQVDVPGFDPGYGWGRLDAAAAVARAFDPPPDPPILRVAADPLEFVLAKTACGGAWSLPLDVYNLGGGSLSWSASGPSWLTVTPSSGTTASLSVRASVDSLASRSGTLTISPLDGSAGAPVDLPVSEQVLSSVSIVNCDAPIARGSGWQYWWPPLASSNKAPPGIPDGAGGALYWWNASRIQRFDSLGHPLWAADGVPLGSASETAEPPVIIGDGSGGAIAVWKAKVSGSVTPDLRAQRVDASGQKRWGADGVWVCQAAGEQRDPRLVPDGAGGAIVVWADLRDGTQKSRIYAQRLDSSGNVSWQADGAQVATAVSSQTAPIIVADGSGGAVLAWEDGAGVFAQRIDGAGKALWAPSGIEIASWVLSPSIVTDGAGGAIIAWNSLRLGGSLPPLVGDIHAAQIYATRVDGAGNKVWAPADVPVLAGMTATWGAADPGYVPDQVTLASDGRGGAFVVWHDRRNGKDWDIYSQRLDPEGNRLWGESGVPVTTAATDQISPAVVSDGRDGAIYAWTDYRAGNADIFVQRLGPTGNRLLGANGLWLEPKSAPGDLPWRSSSFSFGGQYFPSLVLLANHRVLVTWDDWIPGGTFDIDLVGKVIEFASDVAIAPGGATVPPNGAVSFSASGGSGGGWRWSLATNGSGGTIDPATGQYGAGSVGNVTDVVQVKDSFENVATVEVGVLAPISIAPAAPAVAPGDRLQFTAMGGSGEGRRWSLATNGSGGAIDASSGDYSAGRTGGVADVVQVADSWGIVATRVVTVTAGVSIAPASATAPPRAELELAASGGSGTGYEWSFVTNASGGSIEPGTGVYRAGSTGGVVDVVQVTDSLGNAASASIALTAGVFLAPSTRTLAPRGGLWLEAEGGSGAGYAWSFVTNGSGGSIVTYGSRVGLYEAGPVGGVTDVVEVADSLGNTATASVEVTGGISITPSSPTVAPLSSVELTAAGGSGEGYIWLFSVDESGGTIDPTTGAYRAGPKGDAVDVVYVIDSLGNRASASVAVTAGVLVSPASVTVQSGGTRGFTATGGNGGYAWTLATNASGGTIDAATGAYQAGSTAGATDVVQAADPLGNLGTASVTVTPRPAADAGGCGCRTGGGGDASLALAAALFLAAPRRARRRTALRHQPPRGARTGPIHVGIIGLLGVVVLVAACGRSDMTPGESLTISSGAHLDGGPASSSALAERSATAAQKAAAPQEPEFAEGRLIVKFKDRPREPADVIHSHGLRFADHCPSGGQELDSLDSRYHVVSVAPVFASWFGTATAGPGRGALAERRKLLQAAVGRTRAAFPGRSRRAPANAEIPDLTNVYYLEVPAGTDIRRMALDYSSNENVEYAIPDQRVEATALPDDPYLYTTGSWGQDYSDLWAIERIGAPAAWDSATGLGVVVAVVDTGLDHAHVDIASNVWTNEAEANGVPGVDDDGNGYVDDVRGWDFAYGNADVLDRNGRGTAIAGVIAATGDNAAGVVGVAYQARIMPVKALADYGGGYFGNVANAILYAARNGADVINNSYGCRYCKSALVTDAVALARSLGCVVTTGAGNDGADAKYQFPGNLPDLITVASTGQDDGQSSFSSFGHFVDVAAPGGGPGSGAALYNILTLRAAATGIASYVVGTDYIRTAGTSLAAAHVSGTAALLLSANPALSVVQVESIVRHTAADQVGDPLVDVPGFDPGYGWGRLDAAAAVARAFDPPPDPPIFKVDADPLEFVLPQSTCPGPWSLPLDLYNVGGGTVSWSASGPDWLTVTPASGSAPTLSVRVSVDPLSSRSGTLTISPLDGAAGAPVDLPVSEQVLSSVRIVNCDAAIVRSAGTQDWAPSIYNTSPPGIPDGAGGAFYAWTDTRSSMQVFTQRVDSLGRPLWAASGVPLTPASQWARAPAIIGDGSGGAIVAFVQEATYSPSTGHIRAQRVDASGRKLWGANGVSVCDVTGAQLEPKLVPDGAGGAIVTWTDLRNGTQNADVYAQRLDSSGNGSWQTGGVPVASAMSSQRKPVMVADGSGGAILAWRDDTIADRTVFAQRIDGAGSALWAPGGIQIATLVDEPGIVTDGRGGAIIAWNDYRSTSSRLVGDIYAARIDGAGNQLWAPGGAPVVVGVTVGSGAYEPGVAPAHVTLASDGKGGAFVVWHDQRNGKDWDIYGQRLDPDGNRLWGGTGVPVTSAATNQTCPAVISDGGDGAIFAWTDFRAGNADIFLQRLGATGSRLLGPNGVWLEGKFEPDNVPKTSIANAGGQYAASLVPLANHRLLVTWDDSGNTATDLVGKVIEFASDVAIAPGGATVSPNGALSFSASGGSGGGWTWSLATNGSGGTIDPATGQYGAGSVGNVTDVVQVKDSFENVATVEVGVLAPISIAPAAPAVAPGDRLRFTAAGGSGEGRTWSLATNASGGAIDASTGEYTAGRTGGVTDVVQVRDSWGIVAARDVTVTAGLSIAPASATAPPRARLVLAASGGSGTGNEWSFVTNASGGSIEPGTGIYRAGSTGSVVDVVRVTDSLGNTASASITLTAGVSLAPSAPTLAPGASSWIEAEGGSGAGYTWSLVTNASGGSVVSYTSRVGLYEAGPVGGVTDVVEVADSLGNTATASVAVTAGISITPSSPTVTPLSSLDLTAAGGSGEGYIWLFSVDESGGTIDPTTGAYRAGPKGDAVDVVYVIDSLGNRASESVTVKAGVIVSPASVTIPSGSTQVFTATGGNAPYAWTLATNASGGTIDAATGAYQAGSTAGVTDVVQAADSLGNLGTARVTVTARPAEDAGGCGCRNGGGGGGGASLALAAAALFLAAPRRARRGSTCSEDCRRCFRCFRQIRGSS